MVVNTCVPSSLKIWTMFRSDDESISLKRYVPAGRKCSPTPGTSTGPLNVTLVRLFQSSADAVGTRNAQATRTQNTIDRVFISFICRFLLLMLLLPGRAIHDLRRHLVNRRLPPLNHRNLWPPICRDSPTEPVCP